MQASEQATLEGVWGEGREVSGREIQEVALLRGRPLCIKFRGRLVPEKRARDACELVNIFRRFGKVPAQCFNRDGTPSEALKRVVGALTTHDDVTFDQWSSMVPKVLESPWWDGPPSIGVVFGPKVVEQNLAAPGRGGNRTAGERAADAKAERTRRRLAVAGGLA